MEEQEREREGVAIGTPARSERKRAADGAGWLGRYAVGSRRERGPHKHRGPHQTRGVLVDEVLSIREDLSRVLNLDARMTIFCRA